MPKKRLTEEGVNKLRPPAQGQIDYYDAYQPGLVLRVNYGGAKVWRALYYVKRLAKDGKQITMPTTYKLGRYPTLSVKQAREQARQFLVDPDKALRKADAGSFKQEAENFLKRHVAANQLRWQAEIVRCLNKYVFPHWEHRPFREIKRRDVSDLLDLVEDQHGKRQADVVLAIIRKLMNWFAARNDDYTSPVVPGMRRSNGSARKRILGNGAPEDDAEIRALWKAADASGGFGAFVQVALLTGQRKGKVATMKWDDLVDGEWRIPAEPREKNTAGSLRLPSKVLAIIQAQPRIAGNPHVFPGGRGTGALNSFSEGKSALDAKLPPKMPPWVLHDLRRTARSLMSRAGVRPDIAERVLGHAIPGVEGVYDRHHYSAEKAHALEQLAALVETIVNPPEGNVVALPARRKRR